MRAKRPLTAREVGFICAAVALVLDQASKLILLYGAGFISMPPGARVPVLPFFDLVMVWNPGVSYGLFPAHSVLGRDALVGLALLAIIGLTLWLWTATRRLLAAGLGLIIGGAIGNNLIDRLVYGRVADFFHFYAFGYDWYVFNVADAAIVIGVFVILYESLLRAPAAEVEDQHRRNEPGAKHEGR
ncbi:MAG: signal peptidase II [Alphaproteobacteria bacterium]|nr:signal peptidase II [Alphaproteobacteria bacterium]